MRLLELIPFLKKRNLMERLPRFLPKKTGAEIRQRQEALRQNLNNLQRQRQVFPPEPLGADQERAQMTAMQQEIQNLGETTRHVSTDRPPLEKVNPPKK